MADLLEQRHALGVHAQHYFANRLGGAIRIEIPAFAAGRFYPSGIKQYHGRMNDGYSGLLMLVVQTFSAAVNWGNTGWIMLRNSLVRRAGRAAAGGSHF